MFSKFLKMAVANLMRYGIRTALTGSGLALAIAAVLFVNVVSLSFESGATNVYDFIRITPNGTADVWITPPTGFELDSQTGFFATTRTMDEALGDRVLAENQGDGLKVLTGALPGVPEPPPVIYGCSDCAGVTLSDRAAAQLQATAGQTLLLNQVSVMVERVGEIAEAGGGGVIQVPLAIAQEILDQPGQISWVMLRAKDSPALRKALAESLGALVTTDPTVAASGEPAVVYLLSDRLSRADIVSFEIKLAAIYFNQAGSSLLGWLARITLGLGFVLMLSAALLSIEERKREFGIFAAVGVSSDVFYLFFLESLLLFVGSTLVGLLVGAVLVAGLVPTLFNWDTVLKSSALVICYLPPMVIFGALVPAQRLLQKSPLELLRSAA